MCAMRGGVVAKNKSIFLPADQIGDRCTGTLVRHMGQRQPGRGCQHFPREVLLTAHTGRSVSGLALLSFACEKFLERFDGV